MKNGNLVLAGVATVVVALCLIFSFIYLQGDSQDGPAGYDTDTLRTDVVAGDYYVVEMTSDGADFQTPQRFTVLAMIVDDGRILYQSTISQYSWTTAEEFANVLPAGAEPVRTEVITLSAPPPFKSSSSSPSSAKKPWLMATYWGA